MYIPPAFNETDQTAIHTLMRDYSFAILITSQNGVPFATHLPFILDTERGPHGTLYAHMARANPQWRSFDQHQHALVIFQGPHAYISPSWYEQTPSVPTWNYATAHAYGIPQIIEDDTIVERLLTTLIETHESAFPEPWKPQLPHEYLQRQMRALVGFEIPITRLEGKWKISQNRTATERHAVSAALRTSANSMNIAMAQMIDASHQPS